MATSVISAHWREGTMNATEDAGIYVRSLDQAAARFEPVWLSRWTAANQHELIDSGYVSAMKRTHYASMVHAYHPFCSYRWRSLNPSNLSRRSRGEIHHDDLYWDTTKRRATPIVDGNNRVCYWMSSHHDMVLALQGSRAGPDKF